MAHPLYASRGVAFIHSFSLALASPTEGCLISSQQPRGYFAGRMAAPDVPDGQQYFLGFAPVFEQHVLPRLDVQSLLLLAATCRGFHSWLPNPPVFWQVSACRYLLVLCWALPHQS